MTLEPPSDEARVAVSEFLDIVRWLPELAADSDLGRREWDQVNRATGELETWGTSLKEIAAGRAGRLPPSENLEAILKRLEPIAIQTHQVQRSAAGARHSDTPGEMR